ncbi:MAG: heme-dependent peroxidase [Gemmatimonadales bacterium]|nr:MAG: heme-dependent peroxidase [Gemmatimonadales bacterium]
MTDSTANGTDTFPPLVLDGWFMLHQFFRILPRARGDEGAEAQLEAGAESLQAFLTTWGGSAEDGAIRDGSAGDAERPEGWSALYRIVGGEADYLVLHFRSTLEALGEAEQAVVRSPLGLEFVPAGDYLSVVELGLYAVTDALLTQAREEGVEPGTPEWTERVEAQLAEERKKRYVQARLKPEQPDTMPYVCFYPMDKRRNVGQNWYTLPMRKRAELMSEHGKTGRQYAGRVSQVISGSVGFDDWEWAVTLFAADPLDFKALVTEMRYDEVTSIYGEFGTFRVGHRVAAAAVTGELVGRG